MFIINTRSLPKNPSKIYQLLSDLVLTADIIAISETKLNNNSNYNDIQLPGYRPVATGRHSGQCPPKYFCDPKLCCAQENLF